MTISLTDYGRYIWQLISGFRIRHEEEIANLRHKDISQFFESLENAIILDLANGQLQPQYSILKFEGLNVFGIDLVNSPKNGFQESGYKLSRFIYNKQLKINNNKVLGKSLVSGDVNSLPFCESSFDLVTSVAAFEHFLDVPSVIKELSRIIKPGGIAWVYIHNFTSLSGGHNVKIMEIPLKKIPNEIQPWDHLRSRKIPFIVPLNEWRIHQYIEEFANHFEIIKHYCANYEGIDLLSSEIENELSEFSRKELTCREYVIVARKQ